MTLCTVKVPVQLHLFARRRRVRKFS